YGPVNAVGCASAGLCVAGGARGLLVSTAPMAGPRAWRLVTLPRLPAQITGISCPSAALCVAVGSSFGEVLTSTDPARGSWSLARPGRGLGVRRPGRAGVCGRLPDPRGLCVYGCRDQPDQRVVPDRVAVRGGRRGRPRPHVDRSGRGCGRLARDRRDAVERRSA